MKTDLSKFKQTHFNAWIWIILIIINFVTAIYAAAQGAWGVAIHYLFVALIIYWLDKLEKEITRRNIEKEQGKKE